MNVALYAKWTLDHMREKGFLSAVRRIIEVVRQRVFHGQSFIFCMEISRVDPGSLTLQEHVTFERKQSMADISPEDMARLASVTNERVARRDMEARFDSGSDLWLARIDGTIAGYQWSVRRAPPGNFYFPFLDNDAYCWDGWTYKEYRNRNISRWLDIYMTGELKKEGVERMFWTIYAWNKASLRVLAKEPNAYQFGRARKTHVFGRDLVLWSYMHNQR
jgi:GNAT superfamily N-acetyltransferase